jgi:ATP-binding cassette subfamily F protein uup
VKEPFQPASQVPGSSQSSAPSKKKLSYLEAREYTGIEQRIAAAEQELQAKRADLEDPAIASDGARLVAAHAAMEAAQKDLDALYARWAELEERAGSLPTPHRR